MKRPGVALLLAAAALLANAGPARAQAGWQATAEWNSNASHSDRAADVIGALAFRARLDAGTWRFPLGHDDTVVVTVGGQAEVWPRFDGLDQFAVGPQLAWRHKFGLGALAPVLSVELEAAAVTARESGRSGAAGRAALVWRQRLGEATQLALAYGRTRHDARTTVFDRTGEEATVEVTQELNRDWSATVAGRWRDGDVLSYAIPPRPELVALARVRMMVSTFGATRVAYSISARTLGGSFSVTRRLDARSAVTFGYEGRSTEHDPLRYVNHLVSTAFTRQF